jgi:endoglucanase
VVPGYQWNATVNWPSTSDNLKNLVDPRNNLIFEGHIYLDGTTLTQYNSEYTDPTCTNSMPDIGPQRLAPFVNWLRTNGKKGIIGEISVPIDQCWLDRFGTTLTALKAALDVIQGVIFWVMGEPWDASYNMSIEPTGGMDKPQTLMMMAAFNPVAHGIQILAGANHQDVTLVHV